MNFRIVFFQDFNHQDFPSFSSFSSLNVAWNPWWSTRWAPWRHPWDCWWWIRWQCWGGWQRRARSPGWHRWSRQGSQSHVPRDIGGPDWDPGPIGLIMVHMLGDHSIVLVLCGLFFLCQGCTWEPDRKSEPGNFDPDFIIIRTFLGEMSHDCFWDFHLMIYRIIFQMSFQFWVLKQTDFFWGPVFRRAGNWARARSNLSAHLGQQLTVQNNNFSGRRALAAATCAPKVPVLLTRTQKSQILVSSSSKAWATKDGYSIVLRIGCSRSIPFLKLWETKAQSSVKNDDY